MRASRPAHQPHVGFGEQERGDNQPAITLGWPGMTNVYRVDFRVPEGTAAGAATLGLSVAWINGPEVKIPVR